MISTHRARYAPRFLLAIAVAALGTGCTTAPQNSATAPAPRNGMLITRAEIADTGARNAWDAIRMGSTYLNVQFPREGSPARVTHRGVDSFFISPEVLLVVDGTHMADLSYLRDIRVENIDYIEILSAQVGSLRYGTDAGNGVIVVKTNPPPAIR